MIGRDCRCPGCGTCDAASEVERLRERLAERELRELRKSRKESVEISCPLCVDLSRRVTELEIRLTSMKMIGQPHEPAERTEYVVALERVYTAANNWLTHLGAKGHRYNDGIPGELMDAVDNIEQILLNPKRQ